MIIPLDDDGALDPVRVGMKAAALARARRAGVHVLPGLIVDAAASRHHLSVGARALAERGSGGARLAILDEPLEFSVELEDAARALGDSLVARSSTLLEGGREWAGAFTSYVELHPEQLEKAVLGCWASVFAVDPLGRQAAVGIRPGSFDMAVLVQRSVDAKVGGTVVIEPDGTIIIRAVEGSPEPLLQGYARGFEFRRAPGAEWVGSELLELIGVAALDEIASQAGQSHAAGGWDSLEWAMDDDLWILQVDHRKTPPVPARRVAADIPVSLLTLVRALVLAPGSLGHDLILPWSVAGVPTSPSDSSIGESSIDETTAKADELAAQVWGVDAKTARQAAADVIDRFCAGDFPGVAETIRGLDRPDPGLASTVVGLTSGLRAWAVEKGGAPNVRSAWQLTVADLRSLERGMPIWTSSRVGTRQWEPAAAAVLFAHGSIANGIPASPGIGIGRLIDSGDLTTAELSHRGVISAPSPLANMAQLLWDAAGLVTSGGNPAAHLFESARSLGVPSVCGVDLGPGTELIAAVDGHAGQVATVPLGG